MNRTVASTAPRLVPPFATTETSRAQKGSAGLPQERCR